MRGPESFAADTNLHSDIEDTFKIDDSDRVGDIEIEEVSPATEFEVREAAKESIESNETVEEFSQPAEDPFTQRMGDLDERLRLLSIERDSAALDYNKWQTSVTTDPSDFQYRVPHIKNRLNAAEQAIASTSLDREITGARTETPETTDQVVAAFIKNQVLEGKTKPHREALQNLADEETGMNEKLSFHERTIDRYDSEFKDIDTDKGDDWIKAEQRRIMERLHRASDKYEGVLSSKLAAGFDGKKAGLQAEVEAIHELGVLDTELPTALQEDPDFAGCLKEAEFSASEDSARYKQRTGYDPAQEAIKIFAQRFPQKAAYYERLAPPAISDADAKEDGVPLQNNTLDTEPEGLDLFEEIGTPVSAEEVPSKKVDTVDGLAEESSPEVINPSAEEGRSLESLPLTEADLTFEPNWKRNEELIEHITGLSIEDPKLTERLIEDKKIIRAKYDLPPLEMRRAWPSEYERLLKERIKKMGVEYREAWDIGGFFDRNSAGGVYFNDEKRISAVMNQEELDDYYQSLGTLEHELIHAIQDKESPGMPIEAMEYEAYIGANFNVDKLRTEDNPNEIVRDTIFGTGITHSTDFWYREMSDKTRSELTPTWDTDAKRLQEKTERIRAYLSKGFFKGSFNRTTFENAIDYRLRDQFEAVRGASKNPDDKITAEDIAVFEQYLRKRNPREATEFIEELLRSGVLLEMYRNTTE